MRNQQQYFEFGFGRFKTDIPPSFKEHIKMHEEWAFKGGAASRDLEIRTRLDELNKHAESIVAELTKDILLKRQQDCEHNFERRSTSGGIWQNESCLHRLFQSVRCEIRWHLDATWRRR